MTSFYLVLVLVNPPGQTPALAPVPILPATPPAPPVMIAVAGSFDITDELMRLAGDDPYRIEKANFLHATLEFRREFAENQPYPRRRPRAAEAKAETG